MTNATTITGAESLAELFEAFNRHAIDDVMAYFAEDCQFFAAAGDEVHGALIDGSAAIAAAFTAVWTAMPDAHWEHHDHLVQGDRAVSEWTFSGTNADGSRIEVQGVDLFRLRDGKLIVKQAFRKNRPPIAG